jgi:hypothetical protein
VPGNFSDLLAAVDVEDPNPLVEGASCDEDASWVNVYFVELGRAGVWLRRAKRVAFLRSSGEASEPKN